MNNGCEFRVRKKNKLTQKLVLGGSWAPFGRGLGRSWASSGRSWPPLGRFLDVQSRAFFKHGPKMGSKRPFGSIFGGVGESFGRFLGDFGRVWGDSWGASWQLLSHLLRILCMSPAALHFSTGTPALPRDAPRNVTISRHLFAGCPCVWNSEN